MNQLKSVLVIIMCVCSVGAGQAGQAGRPETRPADANTTRPAHEPLTLNQPVRLFNGRDLEGFYCYLRNRGRDNDPAGVFTVADGMIHVSGAEWGCITTREEYQDYQLLIEYKWGPVTCPPRVQNARDSGVLLHSTGNDGAYGGAWMYSIECNIIEGGTGDFIVVGDGTDRYCLTASVEKDKSAGCYIYDPRELGESATIKSGRLNWFARDPAWRDAKGFRGSKDVERPIGEWNRLECLAVGDRIAVKLNGVLVNSCREIRPHRGRIQIQSEGAEIFLRRVDLTPVTGDASLAVQRFRASTRPAG